MPTHTERIAGGLLGLLVGDALGCPYEFHAAASIPARELIDMTPPPGFERAHVGTPVGTWTDDGAQALCLLASLLDRGSFDPEDFGRRLVAWNDGGYLAVDGRVFDVGIQTGAALRRLRNGIPAVKAGSTEDNALGNGSLMRVLPLALWHRGPDHALVADAHAQSQVTHGHPRAQVCCALYCLWARRTLFAVPDPWTAAVSALRGIYAPDGPFPGELEWHIRPDEEPHGTGSGYVVDCLRSARWAAEQGSYEQVVKAAISLGNDTDTTACVAGGIAGIKHGVAGIPTRWLEQLRGKELVEPLLDALLACTE